MEMPDKIWLYRITHINNLKHDMLNGLHVAKSANANPDYYQIGDSTLISYRKDILAPDPPGGTLADYIPFYLGPRSPMLYQIASGWEDIKKCPQEDIIYYISSLNAIKGVGLEYFFTDGHARSRTSSRYTADQDFQKLDWGAIYSTDWRSTESDLRRKEKKQSEFFVKGHIPFSCVEYIGVYNITANQKVLHLLNAHHMTVPVRVTPQKLFYDHL
jgi:hypothetical protein